MNRNYDESADGETQHLEPPKFKSRDRRSEVIESNHEWDDETLDSDQVLIEAADYLGPAITADVLARHWFHRQRSQNILALANRLLLLHRRLEARDH